MSGKAKKAFDIDDLAALQAAVANITDLSASLGADAMLVSSVTIEWDGGDPVGTIQYDDATDCFQLVLG